MFSFAFRSGVLRLSSVGGPSSLGGGVQVHVVGRQVRGVHSKRQIKRLMAPYHPAARRIARKKGKPFDVKPELPQPKYPALGEPVMLSNGWTQPLELDAETLATYPFQIRRTKNKPNGAVGFLPVYTDYRNDNTKISTIIRGVTGDREAFQEELRAVLQTHKPFKLRSGGTVFEVPGNHVESIKKWLTGLGF